MTGLWFVGAAQAATITVDTAADDFNFENGTCSLREAVESANRDLSIDACATGAGSDTIVFAEALIGATIMLTAEGGDLDIDDNSQGPSPQPDSLSIVGPVELDPTSIVIDGGGSSRIFDVGVESSLGALALANLTVQNGFAFDEGGGIRIDTDDVQLNLNNVRVTGNTVVSETAPDTPFPDEFSSPPARGGGIYTDGPVLIRDSVVSGNVSSGAGARGAGLYLNAPSSTDASDSLILRSEISGNSAQAASGLALGGGLDLEGNSGSQVAYSVAIRNSTISGNSAVSSGSGASGGGVYAIAAIDVIMNNVTIADNSVQAESGGGGGLGVGSFSTQQGAEVKLSNTIVAGNTSSTGTGPDCVVLDGGQQQPPLGDIQTCGFNLIGIGVQTCGANFMAGDIVGTSGAPVDAMLTALGSFGGLTQPATQTHALLAGSLAIDAGNPSDMNACQQRACEDLDQRGQARPVDGDGNGAAVCDIGAFEKVVDNAPPVLDPQIPNQNLALVGDTAVLDLDEFFTDPEGQPISFLAASSDPGIATATISQGSILTVTAISAGTTTVTVTASDSTGNLRVARVPVNGSASRSGSASASSGGGCQLAAGPAPFDPLLWLLLVVFGGWQIREKLRRRS